MYGPIDRLADYKEKILKKTENLEDEIFKAKGRRNMIYIPLNISSDKNVKKAWREFIDSEKHFEVFIGTLRAYQTLGEAYQRGYELDDLFIIYNIQTNKFVKLVDKDNRIIKTAESI